MTFPRHFDEDLYLKGCVHPCPRCTSEHTYYNGLYLLLDEELGKIAEVQCPECSFEFLFILAALDPAKAYLFRQEEWEKEISEEIEEWLRDQEDFE